MENTTPNVWTMDTTPTWGVNCGRINMLKMTLERIRAAVRFPGRRDAASNKAIKIGQKLVEEAGTFPARRIADLLEQIGHLLAEEEQKAKQKN